MNSIDFLQLLTPDESQRNSRYGIPEHHVGLFNWKDYWCNENIVVMTEIEIKISNPKLLN